MLYTGTEVHNRGSPRVFCNFSFYSSSDEDGFCLTAGFDSRCSRATPRDVRRRAQGSRELFSASKSYSRLLYMPETSLGTPAPAWHFAEHIGNQGVLKPARAIVTLAGLLRVTEYCVISLGNTRFETARSERCRPAKSCACI